MSTMQRIGRTVPIPGHPAVAPRFTCTRDDALIASVLRIKREREAAAMLRRVTP